MPFLPTGRPNRPLCEQVYGDEPCKGNLEVIVNITECDTCYSVHYLDNAGHPDFHWVVCFCLEDGTIWRGHRAEVTPMDGILALCADKKEAKRRKKWLKTNQHPAARLN